jgi:hypothetical protein
MVFIKGIEMCPQIKFNNVLPSLLFPVFPPVKASQYVKFLTIKETLIFFKNKPIFQVYLRNSINDF